MRAHEDVHGARAVRLAGCLIVRATVHLTVWCAVRRGQQLGRGLGQGLSFGTDQALAAAQWAGPSGPGRDSPPDSVTT